MDWIFWNFDWVVKAYAKYVDVIDIQAYDRWSVDRKVIDRIYALTGKSIFNGDGSSGWANEHQRSSA